MKPTEFPVAQLPLKELATFLTWLESPDPKDIQCNLVQSAVQRQILETDSVVNAEHPFYQLAYSRAR